ncbi:DUF2147 domain-containing protein [Pedobacter sp. HDW13]|uniref:DUF2147 domain-containing protein n=1 Tax=unclassified Pedobacter TaxID=2628915 RepID=UPI000F5B1D74|nr:MULTISPECIES: DUF2147 domain-containing protein [unclassified Pedobacter]QIL41232.1 DUF2147 domain-containing protein [Pedobacter sp. HDW13]RQO77080.1 DUF2147 domain-containing protein [Pedobacter sp. KBW01]
MRKFPFLMLLLLAVSFSAFAQNKDAIIGKWLNPSGEGQIEIYKKGDKYYGKLAWMKEPNLNGKPKLDAKNPDENLKKRALLNLEILKDFDYDGSKWTDGTIYDPKSGKTYSCNLSLKSTDVLNVRGYVGISLLGRSETFRRVK